MRANSGGNGSLSAGKGQGEQGRCPETGEKLMSLQSSERARRRSQGATGQSASPPSLGR